MHADLERKVAAAATRLIYAVTNSANGLRQALRSDAAVRQEVVLIAGAVPAGVGIAPGPGWYVAMIAALLMLLTVELLNTAIEKLSDHVMPDWNARIGMIKDVGSAAVFVAILIAGLIWLTAAAVRLGLF